MKRIAKIVAPALLIGFCWLSGMVKLDRWELAEGAGPLEAGAPAPPLDLQDLRGQTVDLRSRLAARRLIVVTFWATWCGPCHSELAQLARLYDEHSSEGLDVLAVSVDQDPEVVRRFAERTRLPFEVLLDPERRALNRYGVQALPTSILVGPDGTVVRSIEGLSSYLGAQVEYHLRETAPNG